jgi:hypothetical protein
MRRLKMWWEKIAKRLEQQDSRLPFEPEELARLLKSGRHEDMKAIAAAFARPSHSPPKAFATNVD